MARALDLHSRGQGFDSLILHISRNKELKNGGIKEFLHTFIEKIKGYRVIFEWSMFFNT